MGWKNKPTNFTHEIEKQGEEHLRKVSAEMLQAVIMGSPVMDGEFRSNHRLTVNGITNETVPSNGNTAPKGTLDQQVFSDGANKVLKAKLGDKVYIQNNLPYALRLENGHSMQTPNGIYSIAFLSVSSKYK